MNSSIQPQNENWFLRVWHYIVTRIRNTQALPSCVLKHTLSRHHGVSSDSWIPSYTHLAQKAAATICLRKQRDRFYGGTRALQGILTVKLN
jgi:hypothetical protein